MSSYPGLMSSTDDFYQIYHEIQGDDDNNANNEETGPFPASVAIGGGASESSGSGKSSGTMVVLETTNPQYNNSLYALVKPQSVLCWARAMAANYLATNGPAWVGVFEQFNSGTYNNMWMVLDYKLFTPGGLLRPNTLTVAEQLPGYVAGADETETLIAGGYFASYNKALFPETRRLCGQDQMVAERGVFYSHELTARAEIFRRDQGGVLSLKEMQKILRYNDYQKDPLAQNNEHGVVFQDPCNQIACRGDLYPAPRGRPNGAVDAKVSSWSLAAANSSSKVFAVSGPTHDQEQVFCWSTAQPSVQAESHVGQPDCFDFDWVTMQPEPRGPGPGSWRPRPHPHRTPASGTYYI